MGKYRVPTYNSTQSLTHTDWNFLRKLNLNVLYDTAVLLLGIYPVEMKTSVYTNTSTQIFIAALFMIDKTGKQTNVAQENG